MIRNKKDIPDLESPRLGKLSGKNIFLRRRKHWPPFKMWGNQSTFLTREGKRKDLFNRGSFSI